VNCQTCHHYVTSGPGYPLGRCARAGARTVAATDESCRNYEVSGHAEPCAEAQTQRQPAKLTKAPTPKKPPAPPRVPPSKAELQDDTAGATWCPWCGEHSTGGDFCDVSCMREYWRDKMANP